MDTGGWNPNTGYGLNFRAVLDGSWKDSMEGEAGFVSDWKLFKLHGSINWLVPYTTVDFHLEYKSIIPDSQDVFLYWHSSFPMRRTRIAGQEDTFQRHIATTLPTSPADSFPTTNSRLSQTTSL